MVLLPAGKPGTKRDLDGNEVPQKRSKAAAAAGGGGDAMDVSLPSPTLSAPARQGERVWHSDEHTVFVKGMGYQVKEGDLRQLFGGLAVRAVRMGMDRETGQARVSQRHSPCQSVIGCYTRNIVWGANKRLIVAQKQYHNHVL
jgi:hypothetical protein